MSRFENIDGNIVGKFQLGLNGPILKNAGDLLAQVRDSSDSGFKRLAAADPVGLDDLVTLRTLVNSGGSVGGAAASLGTVLDYADPGNLSANTLQYTQVYLVASQEVDALLTFVVSGGAVGRNIRMAIFNQSDPTDLFGEPNARVAQTNDEATDGDDATYVSQLLTDAATGGSGSPTTWVVPTTGYYWFAYTQNATNLKVAVTDQAYPAGYLPRREETITSNTIPATAGTLTNPSSAVVLVGGKFVA